MKRKAEELARAWMLGTREGPGNRPAWAHPEDIVRVIENEMPGYYTNRDHLVQVAWLHDIIEDGKKPDGSSVTTLDLLHEGISPLIAHEVSTLTRTKEESRQGYLAVLASISELAKIVKCVDRLCNLREAAETFKDKRWIRYVGETCLFVYPLTEGLSQETRTWLGPELLRAAQRRPLYRGPG
jgi:(p)ppGpp synthase/HD superfamily hydrolase